MRARHRLSKLLLRHGIVYSGGKAWTLAHDAWLGRQHFDRVGTEAAFEDAYEAVCWLRVVGTGWTRRSPRSPRTASSPRWCADWRVCAGSRR